MARQKKPFKAKNGANRIEMADLPRGENFAALQDAPTTAQRLGPQCRGLLLGHRRRVIRFPVHLLPPIFYRHFHPLLLVLYLSPYSAPGFGRLDRARFIDCNSTRPGPVNCVMKSPSPENNTRRTPPVARML
jgi:hypothetical protein